MRNALAGTTLAGEGEAGVWASDRKAESIAELGKERPSYGKENGRSVRLVRVWSDLFMFGWVRAIGSDAAVASGCVRAVQTPQHQHIN